MKIFPPAVEPAVFGGGRGVLFWYGAEHVARAENSRRYRIENRLEHLSEARSYTGRQLPDRLLEGVRLVISVRPFVDRVARREFDRLRARGVSLWADYDDLLFDGSLDDFPNARRFWHRLRWRRRLPVYREGLDAFDGFTCTTAPIAEALSSACPDAEVHVVPNVPAPAWIERGWARYGHLAWRQGAPRVLRYFPGSPSHDEDFATVEDALVRLLHSVSDLELEIVGYLNFRQHRFPRGRVRHRPKVPYEELPRDLLPTWLNLVPLAPTPYSRARSTIKQQEAAAFGVPSVVGGAGEIEQGIRVALASGR
jgi:hypothetical protein